jgi:hypothetical protein
VPACDGGAPEPAAALGAGGALGGVGLLGAVALLGAACAVCATPAALDGAAAAAFCTGWAGADCGRSGAAGPF